MSDVQAVRYEMRTLNVMDQWSDWEEIPDDVYWSVLMKIDPEFPRRVEVRALGVIQDEGNLLIPGPDGFKTWTEAAVHERCRRVRSENELKKYEAEPTTYLYRYRTHHANNTSTPGWDDWVWCDVAKYDEIVQLIADNKPYHVQRIRAVVVQDIEAQPYPLLETSDGQES